MDKLGLHVPSLIVYLVNFLLLLGILYLFAYKRILNTMDQRSQRIKESLEAADRAREDAARAQEEMKKQMDVSRRESAVLLEEARRAADRFREEERVRAQQEVQAFIEKARADIRRERDVAVDEVRQHFAALAITAAERIISRSLDRRAHKELIEQVLKESEELSKS